MNSPEIKLYGYPDSPYAARVQWLLEELGLEYTWKEVDLVAGKQNDPEFLDISPFGQIPAIRIDDVSLFDSVAILKFVSKKFGVHFYSDDELKACEIDAWGAVSSNEVGEPVSKLCWQRYWKKKFNQSEDKQYSERLEKQLNYNLDKLNKRLGEVSYLAGEFSIADISLFPLLVLNERAEVDLTAYQNIIRWLEDIKKRPSFEKVYFEYLP